MSMGFVSRCICILGIFCVAACGGAPPKPVATKVEIIAAADINPDPKGQPARVVVRLFQLKTDSEFTNAKFFDLYDKEKEALGPSLISRDEFYPEPGAHIVKDLPVSPDIRFFGVLAAYRDSAAQWHAVAPVPPKSIKRILKEQKVSIQLNKAAVSLAVNEK
jgi:type VI secretion system protein VasD